MATIYDFSATTIDGEVKNFEDYRGKILLIVNTASACGLTPQFQALEELYQNHQSSGLEILGFPCNQFGNQDSGSNEEIKGFCQLNYGVTFTMFEKIDVNGEKAHPLFSFLKKEKKSIMGEKIKWNFTKFLVDSKGKVYKRYAPTTTPDKLEKDIKKLLEERGSYEGN